MPGPTISGHAVSRRLQRTIAVLLSAALGLAVLVVTAPAHAAGNRLDLRVLVVTDHSVMVDAIAGQLDIEGVPHTDVSLTDAGRPTITAGFLANGGEGHYQAIVLPQSNGGAWAYGVSGLSTAEMAAISAYESAFGVRQVDADETPGPQVGLQSYGGQTSTTWAGSLTGMTATATNEARASSWSYLKGPIPVTIGTYAILSTPLSATSTPALPTGATFTPMVTVPIPGASTAGTLVGAYAAGGVEQLVLTGAFSVSQQHFRMLAHGLVSWMTRGVHFGYNRNYYSQQFDDAFSYDSRWNATYNCTPGEDCAAALNVPASDIRMTAADVDHLASWQSANDYTPTLAFNGYYTKFDADGNPWNGTDGLTNEFVKLKSSFRWLNHGYEHIFQGCQQDFTTIPWHCVTTDSQPPAADGSNIVWTSRAAISNEISSNIATGQALGLPFDVNEYLSGEHSGLYLTPQQPVDNPNFGAALTANSIKAIGADASREPAARTVGSALTIPRHPVAVYYNVSTRADEVDEYNWIYLSSTNGGSGYCDANPATATCLGAPLDPATGFSDYILPTDVANDLHFILANDPRPFYAHVTNLTGDYLGLSLMSSILSTYRAAYATSAPLMNLTLTEAATQLRLQSAWSSAGMAAGTTINGYVQDGVVTVNNPTTTAAPLTVPLGTSVAGGGAFGSSYGGETSGWVTGGTTLTAPRPVFTSAAAATVGVGTTTTIAVRASGAQTMAVTGALPAGMTFADNGDGSATLTGAPAAGTEGSYPLTFSATNGFGSASQAFTLTVAQRPVVTSPASVTFTQGVAGTFAVTAEGTPVPTVGVSGTLPAGIAVRTSGAGQATLSGTPGRSAAGTYSVTVTATNAGGQTSQSLAIVVQTKPAFTTGSRATLTAGTSGTVTIRTSGVPAAVVSESGTLPAGLTFAAGTDGSAVLTGTPAAGTGGSYPLVLTATNAVGSVTKAFTLTVRAAPQFTSPPTAAVTGGTTFSIGVTTVGNPTPTVRLRSKLPGGVTFTAQPGGKATLTGVLTAGAPLTVRLRAVSGVGHADQNLVISPS